MPTTHRQEMVEAGYAEPHHGHDPSAIKQAEALEAENQARLDALAEAEVVAAKTAEDALAAKRAEQAARHKAELAARRPGKRAKKS
jgi:hypothetical protein